MTLYLIVVSVAYVVLLGIAIAIAYFATRPKNAGTRKETWATVGSLLLGLAWAALLSPPWWSQIFVYAAYAPFAAISVWIVLRKRRQ